MKSDYRSTITELQNLRGVGTILRKLSTIATGVVMVSMMVMVSAPSYAEYQYTLIHSFNKTDGYYPSSSLFMDYQGNFYGITGHGGAYGWGTFFSFDSDGSNFTTILSFDETMGHHPCFSSVIVDPLGTLYGTSQWGGAYNGGTIFSMDLDGNDYSIIHSFTIPGVPPFGGLVRDLQGKFYGTTPGGGDYGYGTVFSIDSDGSNFTTLYSFNNGVTSSPLTTLIMDSRGTLYGTTASGGAYGWGAIYSIDSDGSNYRTLHSFNEGEGQSAHATLIMDSQGVLYGTAWAGGDDKCGTIFSMNSDGSNYRTLHTFDVTEGNSPFGGLIMDSQGKLYGTTSGEGIGGPDLQETGYNDYGTIFSINSDGSDFRTLYTFNGIDGDSPFASLFMGPEGKLYGTTQWGGEYGWGTIFSIDIGDTEPDPTYYESNRKKYIITIQPNTNGNIYSHFLDEDWNNENRGRVDKEVKQVADPDGAIAYQYFYHENSNVARIKYCYRTADYNTDPSNPAFSDLVATYEYDIQGALVKKILPATLINFDDLALGDYGDITHFGDVTISTYTGGHLQVTKQLTDGFGNAYSGPNKLSVWGDQPWVPMQKTSFSLLFDTPVEQVSFWLTGTFHDTTVTTYDSYGNLLGTFVQTYPMDGALAPDGTPWDWYYDRVLRFINIGGSNISRMVIQPSAYDSFSIDDLSYAVVLDSTYYESRRKKYIISIKPDVNGNIYRHFLDEDWGGQGHGRPDKEVKEVVASDGSIAYQYAYHENSKVVRIKYCYGTADYSTDPSNPILSNLVATFEYNGNGLLEKKTTGDGSIVFTHYLNNDNRVKSKTLATPDTDGCIYYEYLDENYNGQGYARAYKQILASPDGDGAIAYIYEYFTGTDKVSKKLCYQNSDFTNLLVTYNYEMRAEEGQRIVAVGSDLFIDFGTLGLYKYSSGAWKKLSSSSPESMVALGSDLYVDFGSLGLYKYSAGAWKKLGSANPKSMVALGDTLFIDYGSLGLYKYAGNTFAKLSSASPDSLIALGSDIFVDFGSLGLYKYSAGAWNRLSTANPESMLVYGSDLIVDFGSTGLYKYSSGKWTKLSSASPDSLTLSGNDLIVDFGSLGLYKYSLGKWTKIASSNPESLVALNSDLFVDFGSLGLYKYSSGTWKKLSSSNSEFITISGTDLIADFGSLGLWKYASGKWTKLSTANPESITLSGSNLIVDYGAAYGLYKYSNGSWTKLSSSSPYLNNASYNLYTKVLADGGICEYDSEGKLIKRILGNGDYMTISYWGSSNSKMEERYYVASKIMIKRVVYGQDGNIITYDSKGHIVEKRYTDGSHHEYEYRGDGSTKHKERFYGADGKVQSAIEYWENGNTIHYKWKIKSSVEIGDSIYEEYDDDGMLIKKMLDDGTVWTFEKGVIGTPQYIASNVHSPYLANGKVVWWQHENEDAARYGITTPTNIYFYDGTNIDQLCDNGYFSDGGVYGGVQFASDPILFGESSQYVAWRYYEYGTIWGPNPWQQFSGYKNSQIYVYDGMSATQITNDDYYKEYLVSAGKYLSWSSNRVCTYDRAFDRNGDIFLYDGNQVKNLTNGLCKYVFQVDVDELGNVVWEGFDGYDKEIYWYDGTDVRQLTNNDYDDVFPQISNGQIAWSATYKRPDPSDHPFGRYFIDQEKIDLIFYDGQDIKKIASVSRELSSGLPPREYVSLALDDGQIIWNENDGNDDEIFLYDGSVTRQITNNDYEDWFYDRTPCLDDGKFVWYGMGSGGAQGYYYDGYSVHSFGLDYPFTNSPMPPQMSDGAALWQCRNGGNPYDEQIYLIDLPKDEWKRQDNLDPETLARMSIESQLSQTNSNTGNFTYSTQLANPPQTQSLTSN
ncbi:MAG: hypothetical protein JW919_07180 [Candidatus Omnitrophica bacterium]|nr:hypothetical protein [Candidatus Omnitrophota bacterium]